MNWKFWGKKKDDKPFYWTDPRGIMRDSYLVERRTGRVLGNVYEDSHYKWIGSRLDCPYGSLEYAQAAVELAVSAGIEVNELERMFDA